jgi:hypothetical protein
MSSQTIKVTAAAVLLVVAALLTLRALRGDRIEGKAPETVWFYDLQNGELFTAATQTIPPAGTPADPDSTDGVRAHVFTCGSCDDESEREVLYLEMYADGARAAMEQLNTLTDQQQAAPLWANVEQGHYVAAVPADGDQPQWVLTATPRGKELTKAFWTMCGSQGRGTVCTPK